MAPMATSTLRETLARNLLRLIDRDTPIGEKRSVRAWATRKELDVRMIDRLTKGDHAVTLDKLEDVAAACGLKGWQLLLDDFDPDSPPDAPISADEREMLKRLRRILSDS